MRHYLRQEPYAANPLVRIREGGNLQRLSLPRLDMFQCPQGGVVNTDNTKSRGCTAFWRTAKAMPGMAEQVCLRCRRSIVPRLYRYLFFPFFRAIFSLGF